MDLAFLIGIVLAFGSLYAMITLEGAHVDALLIPAPMVLVFGATIAVGIAGATLSDAMRAFRAVPRAIRGRTAKPQDTIDRLVELAEKARREGLLSLEQDAAETEDPFLRNALQNIADGTDGDELRTLLEEEVASKERVGMQSARFFKALGGYAPTVGIIGTVVSLTHVLEKLDSPDTLGPSIATAFVATLWGLLSANFIWLPLGDRIARLTTLEAENMTLVMEGALAVQSGSQPRILGERLRAIAPGVEQLEAA
ncbi:MotA/TolQ/ExbB proton channel family protein [Agromyces sp. G08B096]|uniref:MotA/TolQ/ExbB proton channel family protein n=1 Tax=Agromyces sp. G08B096 TaxID=3156399 RepID=A0AAU7W7D6_9MICO